MLAWLFGMRCRLAYIAQQMPLPLTISSSSKSRLVLTFLVLPFWYLLTRVVRTNSRRAVKRLCVLSSMLILVVNKYQFIVYLSLWRYMLLSNACGMDVYLVLMEFHQDSSNVQFTQSLMLYTPFKCLEDRTVPIDRKDGIIVTLYKGKGQKSECSNYRPITLLSVPGKVFAHVILARVQTLLDKACRPQQSGFIRGRSTIDTIILRLLSEIHHEFNRPLNVAYLDIKAAFDSVDLCALWKAYTCAFSTLTLLVGHQEEHPAYKTRSSATNTNIALEKGNYLQGHSRSSQLLLLDRPYISITYC